MQSTYTEKVRDCVACTLMFVSTSACELNVRMYMSLQRVSNIQGRVESFCIESGKLESAIDVNTSEYKMCSV